MAALRHPHSIGVYGKSRLPDGRVALIQELAPGGSLQGAIQLRGALRSPTR